MTPKQRQFVAEYLVDLNATQAAIRSGYSVKTAASIGEENLRKPEIASAVESALAERAARTEITADRVLRELWAIATANPNDLIEFRRGCCRYCWGEGFRYQETQGERERRYAGWEKRTLTAGEDDPAEAFDDLGGTGFDPRKDPNPGCTECCGEGQGDARIKDTRHLSPEAMRLYAGVKVTKDGFEVKMHDKGAALVNVGRHLGMWNDKLDVSLVITLSPEERARRISQLVEKHAADAG